MARPAFGTRDEGFVALEPTMREGEGRALGLRVVGELLAAAPVALLLLLLLPAVAAAAPPPTGCCCSCCVGDDPQTSGAGATPDTVPERLAWLLPLARALARLKALPNGAPPLSPGESG